MLLANRAIGRSTDFGGRWPAWRDRFLHPDGRVIDIEQDGVSHSEGQGYGLLLAQAAGDSEAFHAIERWTSTHLAIRQDALMAWRWRPGSGVTGEDWHNATDGDLFRAWALMRADRDSGWQVTPGLWRAISRDLSALCLRPDPRARRELLLCPSAETRGSADRVLVNPSYIMPRAMRELGAGVADTRLIRAADHGEICLAELVEYGILPDWIDIGPDGFLPPEEHELRSAYDALRIPLYLVWSGRSTHPAVPFALSRLAASGAGRQVVVARDADGRATATSDQRGYRALVHLDDCEAIHRDGAQDAHPLYYPSVLNVLVNLARREGGVCLPD